MYTITVKKGGGGQFATIRKNGKVIEPLEGLYMASLEEIGELAELIRCANLVRPTPAPADLPSVCQTCTIFAKEGCPWPSMEKCTASH